MEAEELMERKLKKNCSNDELVKILDKDLDEYCESCDYDGNIIGDDDLVDAYKNLISSIKTNDVTPYLKKYQQKEREMIIRRERNRMKRERKRLKKVEQKNNTPLAAS